MYSVPGTDIVFACIMCALAMALAFIVGGLLSTNKLRKTVDRLNYWHEHVIATNERLQAESSYNEGAIIRQMRKKHRLAMQKYRAKCDRQVVHHMETYTANQQIVASDYERPDFSLLLSK